MDSDNDESSIDTSDDIRERLEAEFLSYRASKEEAKTLTHLNTGKFLSFISDSEHRTWLID